MSVPSPVGQTFLSATEQTGKNACPRLPAPRRWRPLMPSVGWRWLWKQAAPQPRPREASSLARPRRMRRTARSVVLWTLCCYAAAQLPALLFMERWKPALPANEEFKWPQPAPPGRRQSGAASGADVRQFADRLGLPRRQRGWDAGAGRPATAGLQLRNADDRSHPPPDASPRTAR